MQFFTSLVLDRARVALEPVHVSVQAIVFALKLLALQQEHTRFVALIGVGRKAVVPEDDSVGHEQCQKTGHQGRCASTPGQQYSS